MAEKCICCGWLEVNIFCVSLVFAKITIGLIFVVPLCNVLKCGMECIM